MDTLSFLFETLFSFGAIWFAYHNQYDKAAYFMSFAVLNKIKR